MERKLRRNRDVEKEFEERVVTINRVTKVAVSYTHLDVYKRQVIKGRMDGYDVNYMPLKDLYKRLDYYTPVIITNEKMLKEDPETVQKFMNAVKKGYEYAIDHPEESCFQEYPHSEGSLPYQAISILSHSR